MKRDFSHGIHCEGKFRSRSVLANYAAAGDGMPTFSIGLPLTGCRLWCLCKCPCQIYIVVASPHQRNI